jgi:hypothetical protein
MQGCAAQAVGASATQAGCASNKGRPQNDLLVSSVQLSKDHLTCALVIRNDSCIVRNITTTDESHNLVTPPAFWTEEIWLFTLVTDGKVFLV